MSLEPDSEGRDPGVNFHLCGNKEGDDHPDPWGTVRTPNSREYGERDRALVKGRAGESPIRITGRPRQGFKTTKSRYGVTDKSHLHQSLPEATLVQPNGDESDTKFSLKLFCKILGKL